MAQTMKVRLNSTVRIDPASGRSNAPALLRRSPEAILGTVASSGELAVPVEPRPDTMFGPRGGAIMNDGSLWVADTGHHRLLGWLTPAVRDLQPADLVIGQKDLYSEGRNGKVPVSANTLNVPTGVAPVGSGLAVADAWNHRVLIWRSVPKESGQPADIVLGQKDMLSGESNRGKALPTADSFHWCYGVHWDGSRLWVADTGNRRVLMWKGLPVQNGQPADLVLGQSDFLQRDENGGDDPDASSMRWPHAITVWQGRLCVTDAGNNRVMIWNTTPEANDQPCDIILGQKDDESVDHNQGNYFPIDRGLNMPYGITGIGDLLIVADTASSRIIAWSAEGLETNAAAQFLAGQHTFGDKGDNRWGMPVRDSFCWPYGVSAAGDSLLVCDSGNNRASLWRIADDIDTEK